ncbi:hypothetical protein WAI453_002927 [Rhynchosporium graminicola]
MPHPHITSLNGPECSAVGWTGICTNCNYGNGDGGPVDLRGGSADKRRVCG